MFSSANSALNCRDWRGLFQAPSPFSPGLRGVSVILHSNQKNGLRCVGASCLRLSTQAGIVAAALTNRQQQAGRVPWQRTEPVCRHAVPSLCRSILTMGQIPRLRSGSRRDLGVQCCLAEGCFLLLGMIFTVFVNR